MIQLYAKGTTDFSKNGIQLRPKESTVTFQDNGQFTLEMVVTANSGYTAFDYGQILEATVPRQEMAAVSLGEVSYYTVTNAAGAKVYSKLPSQTVVNYSEWQAYRSYMAGDKVTYNNKNYSCVTGHGGLSTPPSNGGLWTEIARYSTNPGTVATTLANGDTFMKTADFNSTYIEAATLGGISGYIAVEDCTATGQTEERIVPARTITTQRFTITEIRKEQNGQTIRVTAEHVSYQLGRTILGDCNIKNATPATALLFIMGAMKESYGGNLYTDMEEPAVTGDWSWKNAQNAVMDPKNGLLALSGARMIRDNLDVFILADQAGTAAYSVRFGANMKNVRWTGNVDSIVTRIYPTALTEDGTTLLLPEEYIDSVRTIPFIRPEVLKTDLKVGQTEKNTDGTETELTENDVFTRMREKANARFTIDKCDQAVIKLELDWQHMPDTVEYAEYSALKNAAPGDWVEVVNGPLGINEKIRMTGYTWDPMLEIYKGATFGDNKKTATVAGYSLKSGSVGSSALASGAVGSGAIQQECITAREIEANSITADRIASRSIGTELLMANAVTAYEIAASAVTAEKIVAGSVTTDKLAALAVTAEKIAAGAITAVKIDASAVTADKIAAGAVTSVKIDANAVTTDKIDALAVTTAKIDAGAVTAAKIAAGSIDATKINTSAISAINATLGTATVTNGMIDNANISYARIMDASVGSLITKDATADTYYIDKLQVRNAQMVYATVGELVIKAADNKYYRLDVDQYGAISPTEVTLTAAEIAAGETSDGHAAIIETDLVVADLSANNMKAINALIDKINASRIDVGELWARQAFINQLMVTDISSNTYIQATIGNWTSSSTITQSINSLDSRISSLGYGTVYMQPEEPSHSELVPGDIWIQTQSSGTWSEVYSDYATWQTIYNDVSTWQTLGGVSIMWVWDGRKWQQQLNNLDSDTFETEIAQNTESIQLLANRMTGAEGNITTLSASLTVANNAITAEVNNRTNADNALSTRITANADGLTAEITNRTNGDSALSTRITANADAITAEVSRAETEEGKRYLIRSGIDISADGIELTGDKYIRMKSGNTVSMTLDNNGIDMQTAGKVAIHAKDGTNSFIIFGTDTSTAPFSVGIGGDLKAKSITAESISISGSQFPKLAISETQPSGNNVVWIKPSSSTDKQWSKTPDNYSLNSSGGTLGWYRDFSITYGAADYLSGDLYYGIKVRLYYYGNSFQSVSLKARLQNGNSWIELGSTSDYAGSGTTISLDNMTSSTTTNIMNVSGGTFTVRIETNIGPTYCRLVVEDFILKARTTSSGGFASCSVFYKS